MPGQVIPIVSRREYDFANGSASIVAVKEINVASWVEGSVVVRVHSRNIDNASSSIKVVAYTTAPSGEDPSADFVSTSAAATATIGNGTSAPLLVKGDLSSGFGGFLRILVEGTQAGTNTKATISADLVMKS